MTILFHLISGQNLPVFIASEFIKPQKNIYLITEDSKDNLNELFKLIKVESEVLQIPAFSFNGIQDIIEKKMIEYENEELILNFTGGTKIMSVACLDLFRKYDKKAIYINSEDNKILRFSKNKTLLFPLTTKIKPSEYLALMGQDIKIKNELKNDEYEDLKNTTTDLLSKHFSILGNFLLAFAKDTNRQKENSYPNDFFYTAKGKANGTFIKFNKNIVEFNLMIENNLLLNVKTKKLEYIEYLRGKWFEDACYNKIKSLNLFDSIEKNLELDFKDDTIDDDFSKNEFDIIAMKGIYPYLFECKSGAIKSNDIDKLISMRKKYLGRYSSIIFITFFDPNPLIKERLFENKIPLIQYNNLENLIEITQKKHPNLD